ncbi:MAG TPA: SMP-30/gluconolactonase/LRE family protein [Mycobacteriales bacterium]|nr:SMP-30/gluconolactonase/LRE family protein [Mycobacteriales bacterium]
MSTLRRLMAPALAAAALAALTATTVISAPAGAAARPAHPAPAHPAPARQREPELVGHGGTLYPEGVAWDPTRRAFLVGSARHGTVSVLRPDGTTRTLVRDPVLVSSFGIAVDARRGRLLVTFGDIGVGEKSGPATAQTQSGLGIYDLASGRLRQRVDLSLGAGPHAANDVAVDPHGNAYVTDTLGGAVFRISPAGAVTATIRDPRFATSSFSVNGIVWHPHGYLLTVKYDTGELFKISASGRVDTVRLAGPLVGGDGLALRPDGALVSVTNALGGAGVDAVRVLRPVGEWRSARVTRQVSPWPDSRPTTVALVGGTAFVLTGHLDALLAGDTGVDTFTLRRL